jgi:SAM-dependent methyltransferase
MLDNPNEYHRMALAEREHWWTRTLHKRCLRALNRKSGYDQENKILDAGCGTGGLMTCLKNNGYLNVKGFDLSEIAVNYCLTLGLDVWQKDLKSLNAGLNEKNYDVIISNDTLYFLCNEEINTFLDNCYDLLNGGGLVIVNLPAFNAFSGTHDLAVGIRHRFTRNKIQKLIDSSKYEVMQSEYWPFNLSPLIYLVRLSQRVRLSLGWPTKSHSDFSLPPKWINTLLFNICAIEQKYIAGIAPFGSSIFLVLRKK